MALASGARCGCDPPARARAGAGRRASKAAPQDSQARRGSVPTASRRVPSVTKTPPAALCKETTFSGQTSTQAPHAQQRRGSRLKRGVPLMSLSATSAPVGQATTHTSQKEQPAATSSDPSGQAGPVASQSAIDQLKPYLTVANDPVKKGAKDLTDQLTAIEETIYQTKLKADEDALNFPIRINNKLASVENVVEDTDVAPTAQSYEVFDQLSAQLQTQLDQLHKIETAGIADFNKLVRDQNIPAITIPTAPANPPAAP